MSTEMTIVHRKMEEGQCHCPGEGQGRDMMLTSQVLPLCQHLVHGELGEELESWRLSTQSMESPGVGVRGDGRLRVILNTRRKRECEEDSPDRSKGRSLE